MVLALLLVSAPSFVSVPLNEVKGNAMRVRISDTGYVAIAAKGFVYVWQGGKVRWRATQGKFVKYEDESGFGIRVVADDGTIGGSYGNGSPLFMSGLEMSNAALLKNGKLTILKDTGGSGEVADIAHDGTIIGSSSWRGFIIRRGRKTIWKPVTNWPKGNISKLLAINSKGEFLGLSSRFKKYESSPFIYSKGKYIWLPSEFQSFEISITDLNASGTVVASRAVWGEDAVVRREGLVWTKGSAKVRIIQDAALNAINDRGWIVGQSRGRATVWIDDVEHDLNALVPPESGWVRTEAQGINRNGSIVGIEKNGEATRPFLLRKL